MHTSFADLGAPADLVAALAARGIDHPFPIQTLSLPDACRGRDIAARAPTGSGKTLAFGIPIVARTERARPGRPRAVVIVPTRELAAQVRDELAWLGAPRRLSVEACYGGVGSGRHTAALRKGVDVLVACPGRLQDLVDRRAVGLDDVRIVARDQADAQSVMGL